MPLVPMSRYSVWCEYTRPCGYYKFQKKGVYSSLEEAQVALKFALNGGAYTHMVMEGKDLNPSITGKPRTCDQILFCYGYNDDPLRLYIWAKTEAGHTERLSIKQHQYGNILAASRTYNVPGPLNPTVNEAGPSIASNNPMGASDASQGLEAGTAPSIRIDIPITSPESTIDSKCANSIDTSTNEGSYTTTDEQSPVTPTSEASIDFASSVAVNATSETPIIITASIEPVVALAVSEPVHINAELVQPAGVSIATATSEAGGISTKIQEEKACDKAGESDADDEGEESDTESKYDSLSIIGIKNGRWGNCLKKKVRMQARKSLLRILRRTAYAEA